MSSTTFPTRTGQVTTRAAVTTVLAALVATALAVLIGLAFTGAGDGPRARPAAVPASTTMPTPEWLEGYLDGQVTAKYERPVNRGLR